MMKEKLRIKAFEIESFPSPLYDLSIFLIGHNIMNNPKIVRCDDITNNDIVFYEKE